MITGDYVKLTFTSEEATSERMWVRVDGRLDDKMLGRLCNQPLFPGYGAMGDGVTFESRHILDVMKAGHVRFAD